MLKAFSKELKFREDVDHVVFASTVSQGAFGNKLSNRTRGPARNTIFHTTQDRRGRTAVPFV